MSPDDLRNDFDALLPPGTTGEAGPPRPTALQVFGAGYATAAGVAVAQTAIRTPSSGLTVGEVMDEVAGFKVPGYRYARQGDPASCGEIARLQAETVSRVADAQVMADLKWAAADGGDVDKAGITGF